MIILRQKEFANPFQTKLAKGSAKAMTAMVKNPNKGARLTNQANKRFAGNSFKQMTEKGAKMAQDKSLSPIFARASEIIGTSGEKGASNFVKGAAKVKTSNIKGGYRLSQAKAGNYRAVL